MAEELGGEEKGFECCRQAEQAPACLGNQLIGTCNHQRSREVTSLNGWREEKLHFALMLIHHVTEFSN